MLTTPWRSAEDYGTVHPDCLAELTRVPRTLAFFVSYSCDPVRLLEVVPAKKGCGIKKYGIKTAVRMTI